MKNMKKRTYRILHCIIGNMDQGGLANNLMEIYRNIDKNKYQFDFVTHSKNDFYKSEIEKMGGVIYYVPFKSEHPFSYYKYMTSLLKNKNYETIHIHTSYALMYFDALIAKKYGVKNIIVHSHTSAGNGKKQEYINALLKNKLDNLADYHVAVSSLAAKWLFSDRTFNSNNYYILNNSIDSKIYYYDENIHFQMKKKYKLNDSYVVGITARLDKVKNIPFLVDVMDKLVKFDETIKLVIVGDGDERKNIENLINEKGLYKNILMVGMKKNINDYLNLFDTFLFPSFHEGLGISILEAICAGLPCIISENLPRELDISQLIYRLPLDENKWVNQILKIKKERYIRKSNQQLIVKNYFDIQSNVKQWERFYDGVVK